MSDKNEVIEVSGSEESITEIAKKNNSTIANAGTGKSFISVTCKCGKGYDNEETNTGTIKCSECGAILK